MAGQAEDAKEGVRQDQQDLLDREGSAQNTRKEAQAKKQANLPFGLRLHALSADALQPAKQSVLSVGEDEENTESVSRRDAGAADKNV